MLSRITARSIPVWLEAWTDDNAPHSICSEPDFTPDAPPYLTRVAAKVIWGPASALEIGQFFLAISACCWKTGSSLPGISASMSNSRLPV